MTDPLIVDKPKNKEEHPSSLFFNPQLPDYTISSHEIRLLLQKAAQKQVGWKKIPSSIQSLEDIFENAKRLVSLWWSEEVSAYVTEKCHSWLKELASRPEYTKEAELLAHPEILEQKLMIHQFGVLETLRKVVPEAWYELVLMASERQLAAIAVVRHWIEELSEHQKTELVKICQLKSIKELEIFVDSAAIVGKYIDQAYIKQIELADEPEVPTTAIVCKRISGKKYVCNFHPQVRRRSLDIRPYVEIFPSEWEQLTRSLEHLAKKIEQIYAMDELGKEYRNLPAYLRKLAIAYGTKSIDHDELYKLWESLLDDMSVLIEEGCPIMLVPQASASVFGGINKAYIELRVGFITSQAQELVSNLDYFREITNQMLAEERSFFETEHSVPPIVANYQPFAFGPNVYWTTRGEKEEKEIIAHTNAVTEVAVMTALPLLRQVFDDSINESAFKKAALLDNSLHELGHFLATRSDPKILEHIGISSEADILEELKADTGDIKLVKKAFEDEKMDLDELDIQLKAKLGDVCDYIKNKSEGAGTTGERYHYDGIAIVARLIERTILVPQGKRCIITDSIKAVTALAEMHDEILKLYLTKTPEDIQRYVTEIRAKKYEQKVVQFLNMLMTA